MGFIISNIGKAPFTSKLGSYKISELNIFSDTNFPSLFIMIITLEETMTLNFLHRNEVYSKENITNLINTFMELFDHLI